VKVDAFAENSSLFSSVLNPREIAAFPPVLTTVFVPVAELVADPDVPFATLVLPLVETLPVFSASDRWGDDAGLAAGLTAVVVVAAGLVPVVPDDLVAESEWPCPVVFPVVEDGLCVVLEVGLCVVLEVGL